MNSLSCILKVHSEIMEQRLELLTYQLQDIKVQLKMDLTCKTTELGKCQVMAHQIVKDSKEYIIKHVSQIMMQDVFKNCLKH